MTVRLFEIPSLTEVIRSPTTTGITPSYRQTARLSSAAE
jgi:hypothetical protein